MHRYRFAKILIDPLRKARDEADGRPTDGSTGTQETVLALIYYITQVQFDFGAVALARSECERVGIRRPLICTDRGVVAAGLLERLAAALGDVPFAVFADTPSNPTEAAVMRAVDAYRAHGADGVIALGGGSPIDLAKGVAIMATHSGALADYATILGGSPKITSAVSPLIAIPTTAGTGSEVARGAIIILSDGRKLGFHSWHLVPRTAICDPELTFGLPPGLTAATGMDAVAHCVETFLSKAVNPPADAIAHDGLVRALKHIDRAVNQPTDREARWNMMSASMQGAMAFQKGLGAVHSLSHALGALPIGPHHGTLNAVLLPEVSEVQRGGGAGQGAGDRRRLRGARGRGPCHRDTRTQSAPAPAVGPRRHGHRTGALRGHRDPGDERPLSRDKPAGCVPRRLRCYARRLRVTGPASSAAWTTTITAMNPSDIILETRGLTKEFKGFVAVSEVNLKVVRGTIHALIGPNGAGKTTCFNLLTKFLTPTRGAILFNGTDITRDTPEHIARRGIVRSYQIRRYFRT